jgi:hypothetical protein
MSGMDWIKLYTSYLDNADLTFLPEHIQARFFKLYTLAGQCDANGLITLSLEKIAHKLRISMDELHETIKLLSNTNPVLFCNNGNGPEVPVFRSEQVAREKRDQDKENNRLRQEKYREEHKRISNVLVTEQSQSQSQESDKSQSQESEDNQSVSDPPPQPTDDDLSQTDRKRLICTHAGIPPKFSTSIIDNRNARITPEDLLAELARNYSRKGKVKNPGYITGLNLAKITPELPAAEWYDQARWLIHLPGALKSKLGLAIQGDENSEDNPLGVATRTSEVEAKVAQFLRGASS